MTVVDGRGAAWIRSWQLVEESMKYRHGRPADEPLPEVYWAMMAEARILTQLSQADLNVGLGVGEELARQYEARAEESRQMYEYIFGDKTKDDATD